jgi:hypothetical protein
MFGTLLTGALPRPTIASLKALGYQSPNEKLSVAGIGAGGQPFGDMRACEPENIVALADVDWKRGEQGFKRWEKATRYKDFRQMLHRVAGARRDCRPLRRQAAVGQRQRRNHE